MELAVFIVNVGMNFFVFEWPWLKLSLCNFVLILLFIFNLTIQINDLFILFCLALLFPLSFFKTKMLENMLNYILGLYEVESMVLGMSGIRRI